jgi:hypothetical protein
VSKNTGKPKPELENQEIGDLVPVLVGKNQKPGTPIPIPSFWHPVITGLLGTGVPLIYIYYNV